MRCSGLRRRMDLLVAAIVVEGHTSFTFRFKPGDTFFEILVTKTTTRWDIGFSWRKWRWLFFWDIALCSLVYIDRHFRRAYCLHYKGDSEDGGSSKLIWNVGQNYKSTWRNAQKTTVLIIENITDMKISNLNWPVHVGSQIVVLRWCIMWMEQSSWTRDR
jgi:hypothetical protein